MTDDQFLEVFHGYLKEYSHRNLEALLQIFAEDLSGFGTGDDENSFAYSDFRELYIREIEQVPKNLDIRVNQEEIHLHSEEVFTAMANLDIIVHLDEGTLSFNNLRLSCVFQKISGNWKLVHKHISTPLIVQEEGETVPIKELQKKNQDLEQKVQEKTKELQQSNEDLQHHNKKLQDALNEVKKLKALLPICANCKKIRDDEGYWQNVEDYLLVHTDIKFSHSLCNNCIHDLYPEFSIEED